MQTRVETINTPGNNAAEGAANNLNRAVTISIADLQAIQQRIADLEETAQQNRGRRRLSKSETSYKLAPKRFNLKGKAMDKYWEENHQKLDKFIRQCEQNFASTEILGTKHA